ncbi:MAG: hypothetical protein JZU65_19605 [Chlorobium sp.]|nr:hypothetical protein [Chlorobium sp.]
MKVYLDDERIAPDGWIQVRWPEDAIRLLESGEVTELSLDHDLGDDAHGTGYDVVLWIEEAVATRGFRPPSVKVHSANSSARMKMESGIRSIECLTENDELVA